MRIAVGIAVLSLALGCRSSHSTQARGGLELSPGAVHFGQVFLGGAREAELTVRNTAPFARHVTQEAGAPFTVVGSALDVPGGGAAKVTVRFAPVAAGSVIGSLTLDDGDERLEVPLDGSGMPVPSCPEAAACRSVTFDPNAGKCVDAAGPDGVACATACVTGGSCLAGACAGQPVSCDDGDPCTTDTCDPSAGCGHPPLVCAQPEDPCHAAVCDPVSGCTPVAVPDGTACGASSCWQSNVCIAGKCQLRPTPDGAACGDTTPCQARGVCQGHACVQPPATDLRPVWSRQVNGQLIFPGVADAQGNLYWFEDADLVSVTRDGVLRFRVTLSAGPRPADYDTPGSQLILAAPEVLIANVGNWKPLGSATLEARSTLDGSKLWSVSFNDLTSLHVPDGQEGFAFMAIAAQPSTGNFVATTRSNSGGSAWDSWVIGLDVLTGSLQWQSHFDYISGLIVDAAGDSYVYDDLWFHALTSLDPTGNQRWSLMLSEPPALTFGQTLLTGYTANLRDVTTGAVATPFANPMFLDPLNNPMPVAKAAWLVAPASNLICSTGLTKVNPTTGDLLGTETMPCIVDLMLTSRDSVLITTQTGVLEQARTGSPNWSCALPTHTGDPVPHAALLKDRLVVPYPNSLQAFDLPGAELEPSGWPCAGGSLGRGNTPR